MSVNKTVEVIFNGVDNVSDEVGKIGTNISNLNNKVGAASKPFADIAESILKAEAAAVALGAAFAGLAINQAGSFSEQFAEISTLTDSTAQNLSGLQEEILNYSRNSTQGIEEINKAVYSAISAGVDWKDSIASLTAAEKLAVAGRAGLKDSTVLLASAMNAYGDDVSEAQRYSDSFFQTVRDGQTTIPELAHSLSMVTGTAAAAGVPIEDLNAAIAALTASGMPTSQAITAIKAMLSNIIKPTSEAAKAAENLHIQFDTAALKSKGLAGFLSDVQTATGGNVTEMGKLFTSVEGLNGAIVLASDKSGRFATALENQAKKAGATEAAYKKMADEMEGVNQRLVNNMQATLIQFGLPILDDYSRAVNGLSDIFRSLGTAVDAGAFDSLTTMLERSLDEIGDYSSNVAKVLPEALAKVDFSGLSQSLEGLKGKLKQTFNTLFDGVDLTTAEGLATAIQKVVDVLESLTNTASGVISGMEPLFTAIGEGANKFGDLDAGAASSAGEVLGFGEAVNKISGVVGSFGTSLDALTAFFSVATAKQIVGVATSIAGASTELSTMAGALGASAAAAAPWLAAIAAVGYAVYETYDAYSSWQDAEDELQKSLDRGEVARQKLADKYAEISRTTGVAITDTQAFHKAVDDGLIVLNKSTGLWEKNVGQQLDYADGAKKAADATIEQSEALEQQQRNAHELQMQMNELTSKENIVRIKAETEINVKEIEEKTKRIKAALELEGLRTQETTKRIQAMYDFNGKAVIAEAQRIKSAFESTAEAISAVSGSLGSMFGALTSGNASWSDKISIDSNIDKQMRQQEKLVDAQVRLVNSQAKLQELKLEKLESGEALIRIDTTGLEPALEQVLWSIVEKARLQMSMEESEMLVGI